MGTAFKVRTIIEQETGSTLGFGCVHCPTVFLVGQAEHATKGSTPSRAMESAMACCFQCRGCKEAWVPRVAGDPNQHRLCPTCRLSTDKLDTLRSRLETENAVCRGRAESAEGRVLHLERRVQELETKVEEGDQKRREALDALDKQDKNKTILDHLGSLPTLIRAVIAGKRFLDVFNEVHEFRDMDEDLEEPVENMARKIRAVEEDFGGILWTGDED